MKYRITGKWILFLVILLFFNAFYLTGDVNAKEVNTQKAIVLTSSKKVGAHQKSTFSSIVKGDSGDTVIEIQERLAELGYLTSSADGKFGPGTEQAVQNFQAANDLEPDGVVGEKTYKKMFSSNAKYYVAPVSEVSSNQSSASSVTRSSQGATVWITKTGKKYHSISHCGSTKTSWEVSLSEAEDMGLTKCGKCW